MNEVDVRADVGRMLEWSFCLSESSSSGSESLTHNSNTVTIRLPSTVFFDCSDKRREYNRYFHFGICWDITKITFWSTFVLHIQPDLRKSQKIGWRDGIQPILFAVRERWHAASERKCLTRMTMEYVPFLRWPSTLINRTLIDKDCMILLRWRKEKFDRIHCREGGFGEEFLIFPTAFSKCCPKVYEE